jgi:hypothetical protein
MRFDGGINPKETMTLKKHVLILTLLVGLLLSSCAGQATEAPTLDASVIMTDAVNTFVASMNLTQTAQALLITNTVAASPTNTSTPVSQVVSTPPPTWTLAPVFNSVLPTVFKSPTATGTQYTPTVNPGLSAVGCNNLGLVYDVNVPAGSVFKPGENFTKTWKVENNGTCNWVYLYHLVFVTGDRMDGDPPRLSKVIVPGQWTQLSVNLIAPSKPGTYTGSWRMATQPGTPFGVTLSVSIVVSNPTDTPQPTSTSTATATATSTPVSYP